MCPVGTISVIRVPTDGRLAGMQCYSTAASMDISNATPLKNVSDLLVVAEAGERGLMHGYARCPDSQSDSYSVRQTSHWSQGLSLMAARVPRQCHAATVGPLPADLALKPMGDVEHKIHCVRTSMCAGARHAVGT